MKNFALIGIAGYIAPRHLKAMKETKNHLVAAIDPHDSVGILDKYFYDVSFFTEFERFDRHLEKLRRKNDPQKVDYISICSPNHLHDAHIRFALRIGANAICEKPLVINPWNLDALQEIEHETGNKVYNVLQLRVHDSLKNLKQKLSAQKTNSKYDVVLTYITSRGPWYYYSWKGNIEKSGGIATNIGIHFFDMLIWLFGKEISSEVYLSQTNKMSGFLELKNANVKWFLSIDRKDLPMEMENTGNNTYRSVTINGEEIDFTYGFEDLHTQIYKEILTGSGFGIDDARPSIKAAYNIRHAKISEKIKDIHPLALKIIKSTKDII